MLVNLEKYEILDEIGHGGMATVYRARDKRLDRFVALKVMHPHLRAAGEARARFTREAQTIARLRHPHILDIYDYSGEESDEGYIAAELLTGPTLKRFGEDHPDIPAEIAACFVLQVASALAAAHRAGVIHRDVKPENILIHAKRSAILTDFGIAQLVDQQSMTATGQILGSPGHMAPEQVEGRECDSRTDLFSLGTVLYYLSTSRLPFSGRNPHQVLKQIVDGTYADPIEVRPSIGESLRSILVRSLESDPERRYQSADLLIRDLRVFLSESGIDDPDASLEHYLTDPDVVAIEMKQSVIQSLLARAEVAFKSGEMLRALDHVNRVLALDERNERALVLIRHVSRRKRIQRVVMAIGIGGSILAGALIAVPYALRQWSSADDSGSASTSRNEPPRSTERRVVRPPLADTSTFSRVGPSPNHLNRAVARKATDHSYVRRTRDATSDPAQAAELAAGAERTVVFRPFPQNVSIGVDGAEPRPYGPSFRELPLPAGAHTFKVVGGYECCIDNEFTRSIPNGPGQTELVLRLQFRPASVYVRSNTAGSVVVDSGIASGKTHSLISVPIESGPTETHKITVTAPGRRAYTSDMDLRAGKISEIQVELEPVQGDP